MRDLQEQLDEIFKDYPDKVNALIDEEANRVAKETAQMLKTTSPRRKGKYARGWRAKKSPNLRHGSVTYNTQYPLTHLLENGHVIRNQYGTYGRVSPKKHIKPAEEAGVMKYELRLRVRISRGLI